MQKLCFRCSFEFSLLIKQKLHISPFLPRRRSIIYILYSVHRPTGSPSLTGPTGLLLSLLCTSAYVQLFSLSLLVFDDVDGGTQGVAKGMTIVYVLFVALARYSCINNSTYLNLHWLEMLTPLKRELRISGRKIRLPNCPACPEYTVLT